MPLFHPALQLPLQSCTNPIFQSAGTRSMKLFICLCSCIRTFRVGTRVSSVYVENLTWKRACVDCKRKVGCFAGWHWGSWQGGSRLILVSDAISSLLWRVFRFFPRRCLLCANSAVDWNCQKLTLCTWRFLRHERTFLTFLWARW